MERGRRKHQERTQKRRRLPAELKAKIALAAVRGEKTINELAADHQVHPVQISNWKKLLQEQAPELFADKRAKADASKAQVPVDELYQQIGRLQFELEWLKKKLVSTAETKRALIEPAHDRLSIARQCQLIDLPRSTVSVRRTASGKFFPRGDSRAMSRSHETRFGSGLRRHDGFPTARRPELRNRSVRGILR